MTLFFKVIMSIAASTNPATHEGYHYDVSRVAADVYEVPKQGVILTHDCDYTARKSRVKIVKREWSTYINFYDEQGEVEAECEIASTKGR